MTHRPRALVVAVLALALAGCDDPIPGSDVDTGVRGVVLAGPQCPVVQEGSPCPDLPMADVEVRALLGTSVVQTARTDAEGRFEILLEAGPYVLEAVVDGDGGPPFARPVEVTVPDGGFVTVTVPVDTGIRRSEDRPQPTPVLASPMAGAAWRILAL